MRPAADGDRQSAAAMMCLSIQQQATSCSEAPPPLSSAVRGAEENKSIKAGALLLAPLEQGGARAVKGEAPCVLDSIRQSVRHPLGAGCKEGGCRPV